MFTYYLDLAFRSLKRNVALTILMIVAIAFGVGASMTTLTVLHVLSADPIPGKSGDLYYVQLDARKAAGFVPLQVGAGAKARNRRRTECDDTCFGNLGGEGAVQMIDNLEGMFLRGVALLAGGHVYIRMAWCV